MNEYYSKLSPSQKMWSEELAHKLSRWAKNPISSDYYVHYEHTYGDYNNTMDTEELKLFTNMVNMLSEVQ